MNSADKQAVLHCLKSMIDEEVCEECPLYGTTGTDHCEEDCVRLAINALSSSENPNKWIPVSERLPEEAGMYLCSYDDDDVGTSYFNISMNEFNMLHEQVSAWMYIPEPYKQEVEG